MLRQTTMTRPRHPELSHPEPWLTIIASLFRRDFIFACGLLLALFVLI